MLGLIAVLMGSPFVLGWIGAALPVDVWYKWVPF